MEAIGQLAGGVAHDFNNILAAMILNLGLLRGDARLHRDLVESLVSLEKGAQRATDLTRQLLQFSRRQVMRTELLNLNEVLDNSLRVLRRLLGESIDLHFQPGEPPAWIHADRRMIDQMLTCLCLNARDAMSGGGRLSVEARMEDISAARVKGKPDARAGGFACLTVADTGCGMDAATQKRLFEPFFTTKDVGQGTGLSLASVHGIVKQHQGWVEVESAPGEGATFRVFLPIANLPEAVAPTDPHALAGGHESILVVEDDESVRQVLALALRRLGYRVLEAANGVEAVQLWHSHGDRVSLLLTDMVMPEGLTGRELAERLRGLKPNLRVIYTSGYSTEWAHAGGAASPGMRFLGKPYQMAELAKVVRECLDVR
jgi:CheY-like chemotaxis protein